MVKPFQFARLPEIYFGLGKLADLPGIIKRYGKRVILVTGRNSFIHSNYAQKLYDDFKKNGIAHNLIMIISEPSPHIIDQVVRKINNEPFDMVVGIGGGSVIDAGKAISAMLYRSESVIDFLEGVGSKEHPGTKIPFIAVPTTSGTGSEATKNAVLSETGKNGFKRSLRHNNFVPEVALVDPELTLQCPASITAASGMDCFTQLAESYLSEKSDKYTDALAMEGFKAIKSYLVRSFRDGLDSEARSGMSFAALTSGICLANAGLGVVHGFASSIGGTYNIPHGIICGTLMASANEINIRELRRKQADSIALYKYSLLGKVFLDEEGKTDDYYIDGFINYLKRLTDELKLPAINKYGLEERDIEPICLATDIKNNPVKLTKEDLIEIVTSRIL
jgi:alcohol dehydrogenase class IV